jgi:hypothetical protein
MLPAQLGSLAAASTPLAPPPLLQGSTWAVRRRNYHTHDRHPPRLAAEVRPGDVPYLRPAARYAVWSDRLQASGGMLQA